MTTPPTGPWRLICPPEDPRSAREFVGAAAFQALERAAEQLGLRRTWDPATGKLYIGLPARAGSSSSASSAPASIGPGMAVPFYNQYDSRTDQGNRMCRSSSHAGTLVHEMAKLDRHPLSDSPNADDEYLARVNVYGDTTEWEPHRRALAHFGLKATFRTDLDWDDVDRQLAAGHSVPIGIYHAGPIGALDKRRSHWINLIEKVGSGYRVHDSAGELDLVAGVYLPKSGRGVIYSRKNLEPRWKAEGARSGWGTIV